MSEVYPPPPPTKMKDFYITSTLHNEWNLKFNPRLCAALEKQGMDCYLPQRDTNQKGAPEEIFKQNLEGIKNSKRLLAVALNETPNWGGEIGFAYGVNKPIVALTQKGHEIPLILKGMITSKLEVDDLENIENYIDQLIALVK